MVARYFFSVEVCYKTFLLFLSPRCLAVCSHHLSPRIGIGLSIFSSVPKISYSRYPFTIYDTPGQGYGTSEIQFGHALKKHERSLFILQSKAGAKEDPQLFREGLEMSFKKLQVRPPEEVAAGRNNLFLWRKEPHLALSS